MIRELCEWAADLADGVSLWALELWDRLAGNDWHPSPELVQACQLAREAMVVAMTQCPGCGYLGDSVTYELGSCPRCGAGLFWRLTDPEAFYALHIKPGMLIWHPVADDSPDGSVLVLAVDGPDAEGMMTLTTPLGPARVVMDWPCREFTAADGDLVRVLLMLANEHDL